MEVDVVDRWRLVLRRYQPRLLSNSQVPLAGVLVPLHQRDGGVHILFTKRTEEVVHHKGQISFPGGAFEPEDEDLKATALRETYEEIGVRPEDVEVIGQLDDIITISNFRVQPYVGVIGQSPYPFVLNRREVAEILAVPAAHLLDGANFEQVRVQRDDREVMVPGYRFGQHLIYGATAMILKRLLDLVAGPS